LRYSVAIFVRVSTWEHDEALLEFASSPRRSKKITCWLAEQEIFLEQLERSSAGQRYLRG